MAIKILQLHKRSSYEYQFIQDKYAYSLANNCFAIADGTTQSFCSERWAELITRRFVAQPTFDVKSLIASLTKAAQEFKDIRFPLSLNPAKAALERDKQKKGATATFIGAQLADSGTMEIIGSGDSNVFIFRNGHLMGFPFSSTEDLDANNCFLNTARLLDGEVDESFFFSKILSVEQGDMIILATDALSRFLLRNGNIYKTFLPINDFEAFHRFCLQHWEDKTLEEDDITALIIDNFPSDLTKEIVPPPRV